MNVIVVGADHYNTLWLIRSLGMGGFDVITIIVNPLSFKSFVSKSKYCKKSYVVPTLEDVIILLDNFLFEGKVPLFASSDAVAEILDKSYNILSHKYYLHNCNNEQGGIVYWMDKYNMLLLAKDCGLVVPFSIIYNLDNFENKYEDIPYPCLVKPEISARSSKNAFCVCKDETELKFSLRKLRKLCEKVVLQELVQGKYEYLIYGVSTKDDIILPGGLRKVHTCSETRNMGMASYAYISSEIPKQLGNFDKIKQFVKSIKYQGLFSIEFIITNDKAYFLEINLRNDGTCYFTTQAGVNLPAIWAASCYGVGTTHYRITLKRPRTYGINEINYLKYTLMHQSLLKSIREISKVRACSLFKWNDMKPVIFKLWNKVSI